MSDEGSGARRCIFCGSEIVPGTPGEHVYPKWLRKFLADGQFFEHVPGTYKHTYAQEAESWLNRGEYKSKDAGPQVDTVCRTCNHGWMSDLEAAASPLLTPMIEGETQGLDINRQVVISRWASKTAMVWEQLVPEKHRNYSEGEHRWMKEKATPPPDTTVRLGHYTGSQADFIEHKRNALFRELPTPDTEDSVRPDAHRTVIVIGKFVIEIVVRRAAGSVTAPAGVDLDDLLMLIWPTSQPRCWPPRIGMGDKTLESLHEPSEAD
jgi:hypothetical protein